MARGRIPDVAVKRLPIYLRVLTELQDEDVEIISSAELARRTGFSSEQIRKDLAYFGAFGTRGVGYSTSVLADRIKRILGLHREVRVAVVGAGNLGTALVRYLLNRREHDVTVAAVFDADPNKIGQRLGDLTIHSIEDIAEVTERLGIRMAVLTVPASVAQQVAEQVVDAGIDAILNFSPVKLDIRKPINIENIDLSIELQTLAYYIAGDGNDNRSDAGENA